MPSVSVRGRVANVLISYPTVRGSIPGDDISGAVGNSAEETTGEGRGWEREGGGEEGRERMKHVGDVVYGIFGAYWS